MTKKGGAIIVVSLLLSAVLIYLDQLSKTFMKAYLLSEGPQTVIPKVLGFYYVENTGAAFNLLDQQRGIFLVIAFLCVVFCLYGFVKTALNKDKEANGSLWILRIFLILILSGAVGNAIDRWINGYVVDFIRVLFIDFPVFNLADCYVVVGCFFLVLTGLFRKGTFDDIERSLFSRHD